MNKKIVIIGGIAVAAAVVLAFFLNRDNVSEQKIKGDLSSQGQKEAVDLVLSAFEGRGSIKCTYSNNDSIGTAYVKNGMVRVEGTAISDGRDGNIILKNDTLWAWGTGDDTGFMLTNVSEFQKDLANSSEEYVTDTSNIRKTIEESSPTCNAEDISDSVFDPPANVKFQDYSSLKDDIKSQIPDGFELPKGISLPGN